MSRQIKTAAELGKYCDETLDGLISGAITAEVARERTRVENKILKTQLNELRNARKKGEKPNIPFWNEL